jgi:hypothetical protein
MRHRAPCRNSTAAVFVESPPKPRPAQPAPPANPNLDNQGRLIRVGSIVCVDGPEFARVEAIIDGAVIVRNIDHTTGAMKPECQSWQASDCTVMDALVTGAPFSRRPPEAADAPTARGEKGGPR